jgi:hypothetical protein
MTMIWGRITLAMLFGAGPTFLQAPRPATAPVAAPAAAPAAPAPAVPAAVAPPTTPAAPPVAAKPAPELAQISWILGSWRCDGKAPAGALGPGSPPYDYKSRMTLKKDLKDFVISSDYEQAKAKANPIGYHSKGFMTYDGSSRRFVVVGVDSGGSSFSETAERDGDKLVAEGQGQLRGLKTTIRDTFTKVGDRGLSWRGEIKPPGAADWQTMGEDNCKR